MGRRLSHSLLLPFIGTVLLIVQTGCALRPATPATGIDWSARADELAGLPGWEARGRIAVKTADDGGQGNMRWTQSGPDSRIALRGPFGVGAYRVDWTEDALVVTGKAGDDTLSYTGPAAVEQFLAEQVGWSFPARSTRYWMLGIADPRFSSRPSYDADGWLTQIEQNDWLVSYDSFSVHDGRWMPRKIVIENEQVRVRLVIDEWFL